MLRLTLAPVVTLIALNFAAGQTPDAKVPERGDATVRLPLREARTPIDYRQLAVVRGRTGSWQLISGRTTLRDYGQDMATASDGVRLMRDMQATEWVTIGSPAVVEYGLTAGRAAIGTPRATSWVSLDETTRVEQLKGVWVLRTETAIVANFGRERAGAEQSLAVVKRYGFNRAAHVGPDQAAAYLFYAKGGDEPAPPSRVQALALAAIGETLARSGVPIPGTEEYVGERVVIDPQATEVKRNGSNFILAHGTEVVARFGPDEWAARDALKAVRDANFTEVCKVGGATFFLTNGQAPSQVGLGVKRTRFDAKELKVRESGIAFALVEPTGVRVLTASTRADADLLLRVVKAYGFDALCECGGGARGGLTYLARTGR